MTSTRLYWKWSGVPFDGHTKVIVNLPLSFDSLSPSRGDTIKLWAFESQ